MPTKGNPKLDCRITRETMDAMQEQIALSAIHRRAGPWTVSTFVEAAIVEKLRKMMRSRGARGEESHVGALRDNS